MIKNENGKVSIKLEEDVNVLLEIAEILEEYVKQNPDTVHRAILGSICERICLKGYFLSTNDRYIKNRAIETGSKYGETLQNIKNIPDE